MTFYAKHQAVTRRRHRIRQQELAEAAKDIAAAFLAVTVMVVTVIGLCVVNNLGVVVQP